MQASDFTGSLTLNVARGQRALLTRLRGSVLIDADRTNVVLRGARIEGDSDVTLQRGDFSLELAEAQPLTIDADLSSRSDFDSDLPATLQQAGNRFQGTVAGGGPVLRIRSDRGEVRLRSNQNQTGLRPKPPASARGGPQPRAAPAEWRRARLGATAASAPVAPPDSAGSLAGIGPRTPPAGLRAPSGEWTDACGRHPPPPAARPGAGTRRSSRCPPPRS